MSELDELDFSQTVEVGAGAIEHPEPISLETRTRVLRDVLTKWAAEAAKEFDPDWRDQWETAIVYLDQEIDFLESSKR